MRVRVIKKHSPRVLSRRALCLLLTELCWLLTVNTARAETAVSYLPAEQVSSFEATRVYSGRTVPGRASELGFKFGGELAAVFVDIGDEIASGTQIAALDSASLEAGLAQADADVNLAAANLLALDAETQLARQTEARFRSLRDSGHTSAQIYDEQRLALRAKEAQLSVAKASLQRAQANHRSASILLEESRLEAPFDGIIQNRYMDEGAQARAGEPVVRLVETSNREAHVGIPESMLEAMRPGQTYTLRWGDSRIPATLKTLLPEVDLESRTVSAVLQLTDETIPLGAVVELELRHRVESPGYWLPLTALTESDRGLWGVFVINGKSTAERRLVEIVHTESDRAFVRGTLNPGDRIISTGVQRIVPGQQVSLSSGN